MRSDERSGIIFITLFLLWGTLITGPLRYFVSVCYDALHYIVSFIGISRDGKLSSVITSALLMLFVVLLLKLTNLKESAYFPALFSSISLIVFLIRCIISNEISWFNAISLVIYVVIVLLMYIFRFEKIWMWISDIYVFSLAFFLLDAWILQPISKVSNVASKIMFMTSKSTVDFAKPFGEFLNIPGLVWGIFFGIIMLLPLIYLAMGRRRS